MWVTKIADSIISDENLELEDEEFEQFDTFIDEEIASGNIIKHSQYSFSGCGLGDKINTKLLEMNSPYSIVSVLSTDSRINTKVKGQGLYYLVMKDNIMVRLMILCWSLNAVTFFDS